MSDFNSLATLIQKKLNTPECSFSIIENDIKYQKKDIINEIESIHKIFKLNNIPPNNDFKIVLILPRNALCAICIYAILLYGATYVPVDITQPEGRISFIINDIGTCFVISNTCKPPWYYGKHWCNINERHNTKTHTHTLSLQAKKLNAESIAAILYTSGSTGQPKGVMISHGAILKFMNWSQKEFQIVETDRIANLAPFHFDLSLFDLFVSLKTNAALYFLPNTIVSFPVQLSNWLEKNKITTWYTVPSALIHWTKYGSIKKHIFKNLRQILFAGEIFPVNLLYQLTQLIPNIQLYNLYGPTETNVVSFWKVDARYLSYKNQLPIGNPIQGAQVDIDKETQSIKVKTPCLFSGYWTNQQLHPILSGEWYDTGDKGGRDDEGNIMYFGRKDRMIKYRGYRIEPAEIENTLLQFPSIDNCMVTLVNETYGNEIAAVIQSCKNIEASDIKKFLENKLPSNMIPQQYIFIEKFPTLSNGKTDLITLKKNIEELT